MKNKSQYVLLKQKKQKICRKYYFCMFFGLESTIFLKTRRKRQNLNNAKTVNLIVHVNKMRIKFNKKLKKAIIYKIFHLN